MAIKTYSDSDSFTAFYSTSKHGGCAAGILIANNDTVTHHLYHAAEWWPDIIGDEKRITTPDGELVASPLKKPMTLYEYIALKDIPQAQKALVDQFAQAMGGYSSERPFYQDSLALAELKKFHTQTQRAASLDNIREIRPDIGPSDNSKGFAK